MTGRKQGPLPRCRSLPPGNAQQHHRPSHPHGTAPPATQGIPVPPQPKPPTQPAGEPQKKLENFSARCCCQQSPASVTPALTGIFGPLVPGRPPAAQRLKLSMSPSENVGRFGPKQPGDVGRVDDFRAGTGYGTAQRVTSLRGVILSRSRWGMQCCLRRAGGRSRRCRERGHFPLHRPEPLALGRPAAVQGPMLPEDVRAELASGQVRDQMPPVHQRPAWIRRQRKPSLIGDVAFAGYRWCHGPCRHCAIFLRCACHAGQVEQVCGARLDELH